MADAAARWIGRARAEDASATAFEALAQEVEALGLPPSLAERLHAAAADERRHAHLCRAVVAALDEVVPPDDGRALGLPPLSGTTAAARFAEQVTFLLAAGETVAIALLRAARAEASRPVVVEALAAIEPDEHRHARLGWDMLDALVAAFPEERATWATLLPRMAVFVRLGAVAGAPEVAHPDDGVLARATADALAADALVRRIGPELARRGLWAPRPVATQA